MIALSIVMTEGNYPTPVTDRSQVIHAKTLLWDICWVDERLILFVQEVLFLDTRGSYFYVEKFGFMIARESPEALASLIMKAKSGGPPAGGPAS